MAYKRDARPQWYQIAERRSACYNPSVLDVMGSMLNKLGRWDLTGRLSRSIRPADLEASL